MKSGPSYRFGPFVLIPSEHTLFRGSERLHLAPRDFELLVILVEHAGHLLRKEDLQQRLWPDTIVEEGNLTKHVSTLRKALGDTDGPGRLIETVSRVGFRFVAPVISAEGPTTPRVFPRASTGCSGCWGSDHCGSCSGVSPSHECAMCRRRLPCLGRPLRCCRSPHLVVATRIIWVWGWPTASSRA